MCFRVWTKSGRNCRGPRATCPFKPELGIERRGQVSSLGMGGGRGLGQGRPSVVWYVVCGMSAWQGNVNPFTISFPHWYSLAAKDLPAEGVLLFGVRWTLGKPGGCSASKL